MKNRLLMNKDSEEYRVLTEKLEDYTYRLAKDGLILLSGRWKR